MASDDLAWLVFVDKSEGRLTALRSDLGEYPGNVILDTALSDDELQVYGTGDGVVAIVANLVPGVDGADSPDFAARVTGLILDRTGLDIRRTMTGTAFHVLSGAFAWKVGPTPEGQR